MTTDFFDEQEEQSRVKTEIVIKYFKPWASIMLRQVPTVGYLDFYCGPGRFDDGTESTPLLLLRQIIAERLFREKVRTQFSDRKQTFITDLTREVALLPGIEGLAFAPRINIQQLDAEYASDFASMSGIPTLSFIDPWGYKGLTRSLLESVIKGFGSEAIFFFNYSRINGAIHNDVVEPHVQAIFGRDRLQRLREAVRTLTTAGREPVVMRELGEAIEELGGRYMIPFRFRRPSGGVHYICFVSKNKRGYAIMKEIMAGLGVKDADGVPKFEYMPTGSQIGFDIERPITALPRALAAHFAGRAVTFGELVDEHNYGTPFIKPNYRQVVLALEEQGLVTVTTSKSRRPSGTMADHLSITFPP